MLGRPWVPFFLLVDHVVIVSQAKISFSFIRTPLPLRWRSLPHWSALVDDVSCLHRDHRGLLTCL